MHCGERFFYPKYFLPGGITELIPGIDCLPLWTAITIASVIKKYADDKKANITVTAGVVRKIVSPKSTLGKMASGVIGMKQKTMDISRNEDPKRFAPLQEEAKRREENETDPYKRQANQLLRDIRPRHI